MGFKETVLLGLLVVTLFSIGGCQRKEDVCTDPSCEDPSCVVPGAEQSVSTKRELDPQTICPVMGAPIVKTLFVDEDGVRIYMSNESCREEISKNFDKYVHDLEGMGQKPESL